MQTIYNRARARCRTIRTDRDSAQQRLELLANWSTGACATAVVTATLLPFAVVWRVGYASAIAASIVLAAMFALGVHVARRRSLATMALSSELLVLQDLSAERRRLQGARTRRALAAGLRRTADPIQPPTRFDPCPVLKDRVAAVRAELLELASLLERTETPNPASVALLRELLTSGTSPLYNDALPASDLDRTLARARNGITD